MKWRLRGIDTPEYPPHAACYLEVELAQIATLRICDLMGGGCKIRWIGKNDNGGDRELVDVILADGQDTRLVLLEERFALGWPHDLGAWCNR